MMGKSLMCETSNEADGATFKPALSYNNTGRLPTNVQSFSCIEFSNSY